MADAAVDLPALPTYPDLRSRLRAYYGLLRSSPPRHQAFAALIAAQMLLLIAERVFLFSDSFAALATLDARREAVWFLLIIILSAGFVGYFALHAVVETNGFELAAYAVSSLLLLVRVGVEFANRADECGGGRGALCGVFFGLALLCILGALGLAWGMREDLRWRRSKALGLNVETNRIYRFYELFSALRKLDIQFSLITLLTGFVFFVGAPNAGPHADLAIGLLVALVAVEAAWDYLGARGVKREDARCLAAFWALSAMTPLALCAVGVETAVAGRLLSAASSASVRWTIFAMALFSLLCRAATVAVSVLMYRSFGPSYVLLRRIIEGDRQAQFRRGRAAKPEAAGAGTRVAENPLAAAGVGGAAPAAAAGVAGAAPAAAGVAASGGEEVQDWGAAPR